MELIIIRVCQNDGKTTTVIMLHNEIVDRSNAVSNCRKGSVYRARGCPSACNLTHWLFLKLDFASETFQPSESPLSIGLQLLPQPAK